MNFLFGFLLSIISIFLILLVLVQRGRGGGLTGALGGMGGQSAFGTKAGDTFTRITVVAATVWILCSILAVKMLGGSSAGPLGNPDAPDTASTLTVPALPEDGGASGLGALENLPTAPPTDGATPPADGAATTPAGDAAPAGETATPSDGDGAAESNPG